MSKWPLYADENFPRSVVSRLRTMGHDVVTLAEDGKADRGFPDDQVLLRALELGRALVTHDRRDFRRLHQAGVDHAGLVLCTQDHDPERLAAGIDAALSARTDMNGKMINVYRPPGGSS